jgi:hypothetical protein
MFLAVGFAAGLTAGAACDRPGVAARPPLIENVRGLYDGRPLSSLRPVTVRVGDVTTEVGSPSEGPVVIVHLTIDGVPTQVVFDATPIGK